MTARKVEMVPIDSVKPLDRNPRRHPEKQIRELIRSFEQFGQYRPLVIDEDSRILAGNGMHRALIEAGQEEIQAIRLRELTSEQKNKLILADNRLSDLSIDDFEVIEELLQELDDYEIPGYDSDAVQQLMADAEETVRYAEEYGRLDTSVVEDMKARAPQQDEYDSQIGTGKPDDHEPSIASDAVTMNDEGQPICPTCLRGW